MRCILNYLAIFSLSFQVVASDQVEALSAKDKEMRDLDGQIIFEISSLSAPLATYRLLRNSSFANFLLKHPKEGTDSRLKISGAQAEGIDQGFVAEFFSIKYAGENENKKNCSGVYQLSMRTEQHVICDSDIEHIQKIKDFIQKLDKVFDNRG